MVFENRNRLALAYDRFPGGIFNPSLAQHSDKVWGIARCEAHNQAERNDDKSLNFTPTRSVLFQLDPNLVVSGADYEVRFVNFPQQPWRAEDYRLFVFQNQLFCTHTLWVEGYNIGMALSRVDVKKHTVTLVHPITIDGLAMNPVEKNWVMVPGQNALHCLYSFYPQYILAELTDLQTACCRLSLQANLQPAATDLEDKMISISTVPQPINNGLYLLVHQKNDHHIYRDHLVKLNPATLLPEAISQQPVIEGGNCEGYWRGYLTVYSLLIQEDRAVISFGEGDRYSGVAEAPIEALMDAEMLALCEM